MKIGLLEDSEAELLTMNLLNHRKEKGATTEEVQVVLEWAHAAMVDKTLIELALAGQIALDVADGEVVFFPTE